MSRGGGRSPTIGKPMGSTCRPRDHGATRISALPRCGLGDRATARAVVDDHIKFLDRQHRFVGLAVVAVFVLGALSLSLSSQLDIPRRLRGGIGTTLLYALVAVPPAVACALFERTPSRRVSKRPQSEYSPTARDRSPAGRAPARAAGGRGAASVQPSVSKPQRRSKRSSSPGSMLPRSIAFSSAPR